MPAATAVVTCPHCGRKNRIAPAAEGIPRCGNCHNALPWVVDATSATFDEETRASIPVLVDFWAPWCGPCRMVSPALAQLAQERPGQIKLVKVNVDESPRLQQRFAVQAIPTLMVLRDGKVLGRQAGAAPVAALRGWLDQSLAASAPAG